MYNPGTEVAHTSIRVAGDVGSGLLIRNLTMGQRCKVIDLEANSLLEGQVLELDSYRGQTRTVLGKHIEHARHNCRADKMESTALLAFGNTSLSYSCPLRNDKLCWFCTTCGNYSGAYRNRNYYCI